MLLLFSLGGIAQSVKKVLVAGEGLPIVMLPGGTVDISAYAPHAQVLSQNYKVIRMEHFNVQYADENKTLPGDYSVKMESEAIGKTLDSMNIKGPVVLVGWSYGAVIAYDFALHHPRRIHSLVLFEPPLFWMATIKNESPKGMVEMQRHTSGFTPAAVITEDDVKKFRCKLLNCDSMDIKKHSQWKGWLAQKDRLRGLSVINSYQGSLKKLHQFRKRVLIMNGSSTVVFHKRINELLVTEFLYKEKKEIPGGHNAPVTSSKEFIQALLDFIK